MMFDMDIEDTNRTSQTKGCQKLDAAVRSPLVLPSIAVSRPSSRMAASRPASPAPLMHRKASVSAGVLSLLESQLDDTHIDSDYEDMAERVQVEVPIVDDFENEECDDIDIAVDIDADADADSISRTCDAPLAGISAHASVHSLVDRARISALCGEDVPEAAAFNASSACARRKPKVTIDDFDVLRLIGKGGYGMVYLVQHKVTRKHYAMKVLRKASILLQRRQITFTMTERSILSEVQHPFIVKLYYAFQSNSKLYLIMEYVAGGELFTHMTKERIFSEDQAVFYAAELVLALSHLHKLGIVFRDAKPENCLLGRTGHLVLTDFGLSKTALGEDGRTSTFCGTPSYMAPEILDSSESYDVSVDYWSLGVLIYEMLTGSVPFKGRAPQQIVKNINKMKVVYPSYLTPDAKDLIIRLLRKKPSQRLGYGRSGMQNIKKHRFFRNINWEVLEKRHESQVPPIVPVIDGDADVSNFAAEFTSQLVPQSIACGDAAGPDPAAHLPVSLGKSVADLTGNRNTQPSAGDNTEAPPLHADGEVDPATAFLGFSFVAKSVLDTIG
ncbi:hypothetical protein GGI11_005284 [Coemansia sp. RSA 2049]|nr:hypothetical protein H4217_007882 [Coemansia sp. RSA 1939]KAJ2510958.1 hypothetical protein GGI11_005284 [Coemansia sp. RSA 2049]KAJ2594614.1 hypothetical protein EV177_008328 [Coemansia sp. RSA 1804]KAJ2684244.1 hypothetical protein GGH99_004109 [Coemansia sp. RSA 1285]